MDAAFQTLLIDLLTITGNSREERPVADFILKFCRKNGLNAREDGSAKKTRGNAGNVLVWPKGVDLAKVPTLFCCHMDTVDVGPERKMKVSSQRIEASGLYPVGLDNRLGAAILLTLLTREKGNFACAFTTQEEIGMFGAEAMKIPKGVKAVYNLDGSQSPGHFVLSTVGCVTFRIVLTGQSSHAGISPNVGKSAVQMAARAISELPLGMPGNDESINIGVIHGGTRSNVIPAQAEVIGEVRASSIPKVEKVFKRIRDTFARNARKYGGSMQWNREDMFKPYAHKASSPIIKKCIRAVADAGLKPVYGHYRGGSDANVFNFRGVPTVNLSIGAHNPHSPKEYCAKRETEQAYRIVVNLLKNG